jgi:tetratricopeptide (TPR) repeat protein
MKEILKSPIVAKYKKTFLNDPHSLVFAPLAEAYRKAGLLEKAKEILRAGIENHPDYFIGYLGLAFCYYDDRKYEAAYHTLHQFVDNHRDNIRLQKLYGEICLRLGAREEALMALKCVLFLSPRDIEVSKMVEELEVGVSGIDEGPKKVQINFDEEESAQESQFDVERLSSLEESGNGWEFLNLSNKKEVKESTPEKLDFEDNHGWTFVEGPVEDVFKKHPSEDKDKEKDFDEVRDFNEEKVPVITHTLVDIYIAQGHYQKAKEVLGKILQTTPADAQTLEKLQEVNRCINEDSQSVPTEEVELVDEGRGSLMELYDQKISETKELDGPEEAIVEDKMWGFHKLLVERSKEVLDT